MTSARCSVMILSLNLMTACFPLTACVKAINTVGAATARAILPMRQKSVVRQASLLAKYRGNGAGGMRTSTGLKIRNDTT
jgi:hypothetical protein